MSIKYTAAGARVRQSVSGFLRYIQNRDHSREKEHGRGMDGFLRYAAFRDRTTSHSRLFDRETDASHKDRTELADYITRSTQHRDPRSSGRAAYRLVISPQDARGIDLRRLTREVMAQLEKDAGPAGLGPWLAAEHRNTEHPHVHVVLAAQRQVGRDRYRQLVITRERLQRMKEACGRRCRVSAAASATTHCAGWYVSGCLWSCRARQLSWRRP